MHFLKYLALGLLLCAPHDVLAHRSDAAMSLIEVNPTSGQLEVSHTLYAHDLEGALLAGAVTMQWLESPAGEAALRDYCLRQFTLTDQSGKEINLTFIGAELRGGVIEIYFTAPGLEGDNVIVDSNLLQDVNENQVNQVNVRAKGDTISAVFGQGAQAKRLMIPQ